MTELSPVMTDLVLEHLRAIRADVRSTHERLDMLTTRMSSVEHGVASLHGDMAHMGGRLDRVEQRLDRIEHRLDLADAPA
jgi:tetrahydromethanopterin S-methyltransferase subunit G